MPFKNKEEHVEVSRKGGIAVVAKHGKEYMSQLGKKGALASLIVKKRKKIFIQK